METMIEVSRVGATRSRTLSKGMQAGIGNILTAQPQFNICDVVDHGVSRLIVDFPEMLPSVTSLDRTA